MLVGRESDLATVSTLLDGARDGCGGALVLRGPLGCGRSALLAAATQAAARRGIPVVRLPGPARVPAGAVLARAVREARDHQDATRRHELAGELLERLDGAPTLMVVDDAGRLGVASWELLACVGRRLGSHPAALLVTMDDARRDGDRLTGRGLPESAVGPLDRPAAEALLDRRSPGLTASERERVLTQAEGNPLALIEFARSAHSAGTSPDPLPVRAAVARAFATIVDPLPPATRTLLFVTALGHGRALSEILSVAATVDGQAAGPAALEPAVEAGLIDVDDNLRLRVRHPLLRALLWHRAGSRLRKRIRAALHANPTATAPVAPSPAESRRRGGHGEAASGARDVAMLRTRVERLGGVADPDEAVALLNALAVRFYWSPPDARTQRALLAVARSVGLRSADPRRLHLLATTDPIGHGAVVLDRLARLSRRLESDAYELHLLGIAANAISAYDIAATFHAAALPGLAAQGRHAVLARALTAQAWAAALLGDTRLGSSAADDAQPLARQTRQPIALAIIELTRALVAALRGDPALARDLAARAQRSVDTASVPFMPAKIRLVSGVAAIAERRYDVAYAELWRIFDETDPAYHPYVRFSALGPLAEAAWLSGRAATLAELAEQLEPVAALGRSPMLCHGLRYARAVAAADPASERAGGEAPDRFREALAADLSGWPFERARLELAYGQWLRRRRRPAEAREALRSATATFEAIGVDAWADRARRALRSVGGSPHGSQSGLAHLTEQQRRVAHLAAAGLSNREIADRLYLSPRTVTTHLSRVYATLAAGSRTELVRMFAGEPTIDM